MARMKTLLYIATHRYVAAIDPQSGEELWRTKLPHAGYSVPTILIKGAFLYVGHAGRVYCLNRRYGELIWENGLPRMGYQPVILAMERAEGASDQSVVAAETSQRRRRQAAAAGAAGGAS